MKVVVVGASPDKSRYANMAQNQLRDAGHEVVPVHPTHPEVDGVKVVPHLNQVRGPVDTVTLYLNPKASAALATDLVALRPRRVIFNPGAESPELQARLEGEGIECLEACTLVMLRTGQF